MKKILYTIIIAMTICVSGCSKNTAPLSSTFIPKTSRTKEAGGVLKNKISSVSENTSKEVPLRAISEINALDEVMKGWYADLFQEKMNIKIFGMDYSLPGRENYEQEYEKGIDIQTYRGEADYYDNIKAGRIKNMEPYIKKNFKIFSRYSKILKHLKKKTYRKTGKIGIYGIPIWLQSFDTLNKKYEEYCVCVPASSRHPKKAMDLIAWSASEEGIMNIAFGPEGQMWKKKKGKYILIYDWQKKMNSSDKFVKTKSGKVDYSSAQFKMQLVGNRNLGEELLRENK